MTHHETKKEKKKRILERNKRNQKIFWAMELLKQASEGAGTPEVELSPKESDEDRRKKEEQVVWSAKTQEIRNRLTGKKRAAQERWNRFAATSDAGGMGR